MQSSKQKQHLGDKNVDGKIILQWVLCVHLQNIIRVIKSRMNCEKKSSGNENAHLVLAPKPKEKDNLEKPMHTWEVNIKVGRKQML
jgi:hypothetical protein